MVDFVGNGEWDVAETALVLLLDGDEVFAIRAIVDGLFVRLEHFVWGLTVELFEISEDSLPPFLDVFISRSGELIY